MRKILLMGLSPPLEGGSERHVFEVSERVPGATVFTQKGSLCKNRIEVRLFGASFFRNFYFLVSAFLYSVFILLRPRKKFEVVHIHENLLYLLAPLLSIRFKVVVTVHGISGFKFYDNKFLWFFFRFGLKSADKIISVSVADKANLDKEFDNVIYISNGVDLSVYSGLRVKEKNQITFVGRIHPQKGLDVLCEAFRKLSKKDKDLSLKIIGKKEGEFYSELERRFRGEKIVWEGFILERKKLFAELASSKVIVFPSRWEALPWPALLEGLGSGKPVVAADLPGMRQIFKDRKDIVLFAPENASELEESIEYLINNKAKATQIGVGGRKTASEYSWDSIAERVQKVYNEV